MAKLNEVSYKFSVAWQISKFLDWNKWFSASLNLSSDEIEIFSCRRISLNSVRHSHVQCCQFIMTRSAAMLVHLSSWISECEYVISNVLTGWAVHQLIGDRGAALESTLSRIVLTLCSKNNSSGSTPFFDLYIFSHCIRTGIPVSFSSAWYCFSFSTMESNGHCHRLLVRSGRLFHISATIHHS